MLKANRTNRTTTKRARSPTGNAAAVPAGERKCAACGYLGSPSRHHIVYRRDLVAHGIEPTVFHDPRNLVWLCTACHQRQDSATQALALRMLPDAALQFAVEVLGADAARDYMTSHHAGKDTRLG